MVKLDNVGRIWGSNYFVYIMTNYQKTTLYIGVTNNLQRRIQEHNDNSTDKDSFAQKYNCKYLIYWERHFKMSNAIAREKQLKKWRREKKNILISSFNPGWDFLNDKIRE